MSKVAKSQIHNRNFSTDKIQKLYIIGNGFDLYHNLPTKYADFQSYVLKNHHDLENTFEDYFQLSSDNKHLWKDFENDLGTFNWKVFFDEINQIDVLDDNFRPSFIYGLEDDLVHESDCLIEKIREAFEGWLTDLSLESTERKIHFEENSIFLNFNYTLTLEEVYQIPSRNVLHIHGDVENHPGNLIFGHNKKLIVQPKFDENGKSNRTPFTDSESNSQYPFYALQKPVDDIITDNENFFKSIKDIQEIVILGHSLNSIDLPYFKEIKNNAKNSPNWKVSFYNDENITHMKTLQEIGVSKNKIEFFQIK